MQHAPITIAFVILALYTYRSGLRAPAMIAFVKDAMIYVFIIAAVVVIPYELGGFGKIFDAAGPPTPPRSRPRRSPPRGSRSRRGRSPLHHARDRLGDGALHVSARPDRRAGRLERSCDPAQYDDAARVFVRPRADRASRRDGARRRYQRQEPAGRGARSLCSGLSRTGSRVSVSPRSRSERSCPPRSCRSGRRTPSPGTSGSRSSIRR